MIEVEMSLAREIAQAKRRNLVINKLGSDEQEDTSLTIDQMRTIPEYESEGLNRRAKVMAINDQVKKDIDSTGLNLSYVEVDSPETQALSEAIKKLM